MPIYAHQCRTCDFEWQETYSLKTYDWFKENNRNLSCPDCEGDDTYRCVTDSGVVVFKGAGWSPDGYYKNHAYDQHVKEGKSVTIYDRREDLQRVMKGEKAEAMKARLKKEDRLAKRHIGPDAAMTQAQADKRIKAAVDKVKA